MSRRNAVVTRGLGCVVAVVMATGNGGAIRAWASDEHEAVPRPETVAEMAARIDELLGASWRSAGIEPAEIADDATFLRRVSLDLNGVTPAVMEVRQFLSATEDESARETANKRSQLVNRLLQSPRYATHMANTWRDILLPADLEPGQIQNVISLQTWLRQQFAENLPYDTFVAKFLSETQASGPGVFYSSLELKPEKLAAKTAQVFLGVQMQCAECHDHPFDDWSQKDFWGYAAFFAQLAQDTDGRRGETQVVVDRDQGEVMLPESDKVIPPKYPAGRMADASEGGSRRLQLSIWMASRDNPFLPRAAVNRAWAHMFGRGLVEPVDEMSFQNKPSHPQLLDELAAYFARTGFDLKNLYRTLANTQAYQRASHVPAANSGRANVDEVAESSALTETTQQFARMNIKTLTADQVYDSLERFLTASSDQEVLPGTMVDQRRLQFVSQMRMQTRNERDFERGAAQALMMMNGNEAQEFTSTKKKLFTTALMAPLLSDQDRVDALFLASVSRFPQPSESAAILAMLDVEEDSRQVLGDVLWAIVNSAEFTLNH